MVTLTPILRLNVPEFDQDPWDEDVNDNWQILDAAVGQNISIPNLQGIWLNSHVYAVGQSAIDTIDSQTYQCNVAHTSADPPTTFTQDRTANPSYWTAITASAQFYANQAQGFADDAATSAAAAAASAASVGNPVPIAGNVTMTGPLTLSGDPTATFGAATKHYVDTHTPPAAASSDYINIKTDYGAKGDGTTDDTAAIQAMLAGVPANAAVFWPAGTYLVTTPITVSKGMTWVGSGRLSSTVTTNKAVASLFTFTAPVNISDMGFTCAIAPTSGTLLTYNVGASRFRLNCFWMTNFFNGININGASDIMLIDGQMFNWANGGTAITYTGGEAAVMDNLIIEQGTRPGNGIGLLVLNGGIQLINSEIIACGTCLKLAPGNGQAVVSMWVCNTAFDNALDGIWITPSGSGVVERCWFIGCWMCSMDHSGVTITSPSIGFVNGIDFNNCHVFGNALHGFNMTDANARRLNFLGCSIAGNTQTGIQFFAGGAQFRISHCTISAYGGFGNNGASGVNLGGACTSYQITDNDLANGGTNPLVGAGVQSGPSPGISELIYGNVGYNSQNRGQATITAGAVSVTVAHSLNGTPRLQDIQLSNLTGEGNPPAAAPFVLTPTSTTFVIEIGVALGFNMGVAWKAMLPCTP